MMPPLMTVGSRPAAASKVATSEVVVVLPWVPAIATHCLSRISSASISARRTTGMRRRRAAVSSGLSRLIAVETTTTAASPTCADARATFAEAFDVGVVARVRALHLVTDIEQHLGDAGHADSADADEMNGAKLARQFHLDPFPRALSRARHKPICRFGQMGGALRRGEI